MGDLDLYQRNDALPHSYTLKRDEPVNAGGVRATGPIRPCALPAALTTAIPASPASSPVPNHGQAWRSRSLEGVHLSRDDNLADAVARFH